MHGNHYVVQIREDLTFEVLNLYPDYDYPGKINRIDITVEGGPVEDKRITVQIGLQTALNLFDGASHAFLRLYSEIGTFKDMYCYPVDASGSELEGTIDLSSAVFGGFWAPEQIRVVDSVGN